MLRLGQQARSALGPAHSVGEADTSFNAEEMQLDPPLPAASSIVITEKSGGVVSKYNPCSGSPQIFPFSQKIDFT